MDDIAVIPLAALKTMLRFSGDKKGYSAFTPNKGVWVERHPSGGIALVATDEARLVVCHERKGHAVSKPFFIPYSDELMNKLKNVGKMGDRHFAIVEPMGGNLTILEMQRSLINQIRQFKQTWIEAAMASALAASESLGQLFIDCHPPGKPPEWYDLIQMVVKSRAKAMGYGGDDYSLNENLLKSFKRISSKLVVQEKWAFVRTKQNRSLPWPVALIEFPKQPQFKAILAPEQREP